MSNRDDGVDASLKLVRWLRDNIPNPETAFDSLMGAVIVLHGVNSPEVRLHIEETVRKLLTFMYEQPPASYFRKELADATSGT